MARVGSTGAAKSVTLGHMTRVQTLLILLVIAVAGGGVFTLAGLPAAWLAGAMTFSAAGSLAGLRAGFPGGIRPVIFVVLGLQIGAGVTPETLQAMTRWPISLVLLVVTVAAVAWAGTTLYRRVFGWDGPTAFFATMPGALSVVMVLAEEAKAKVATVAVAQTIRLVALVAVLPAIITAVGSGDAAQIVTDTSPLRDVFIVLPTGAAAGFVFVRLRVPAGLILGPALTNAVLHLTGVVHGTMPAWVLVPGFILLGMMIGLRFAGVSMTDMRRTGSAALVGLALTLTIAVTGALIANIATGIPFSHTLLAFSPGGLEAMVILAFALNLDPAYVGTHQIARFIILSLAMPLIYRLLAGRWL